MWPPGGSTAPAAGLRDLRRLRAPAGPRSPTVPSLRSYSHALDGMYRVFREGEAAAG